MQGKTHEYIKTIRPLRDGVIADFNAAEQMIRGMIKMANGKSKFSLLLCVSWFVYLPEVQRLNYVPYVTLPNTPEDVDVYMIYEPMAAALGIGLDVEAPEGNMIVDIGGGTTEIAVISLGGIVTNKSIRIAGDDLTDDIQEYMRHQHNIKIGNVQQKKLKFMLVLLCPNWMSLLPISWCKDRIR